MPNNKNIIFTGILSLIMCYTVMAADTGKQSQKIPLQEQSIIGFFGETMKIALPFPICVVDNNVRQHTTFIPQGGVGKISKKNNPNGMMASGEFIPCLAIIIDTEEEILFPHASLNSDPDSLEKFIDTKYSGTCKVTFFTTIHKAHLQDFAGRSIIKDHQSFIDFYIKKIKAAMPDAKINFSHVALKLDEASSKYGSNFTLVASLLVNARGEIFHVNLADLLLYKGKSYLSQYDSYVASIKSQQKNPSEKSQPLAFNLLYECSQNFNTSILGRHKQYMNKDKVSGFDQDGHALIPYVLVPSSTHCAVCTKDSSQKCSVCKTTIYCSRECQTADWIKHKGQCKNKQ